MRNKLFVLIILLIIAGIAGYYWFFKRIENINTGNEYRKEAEIYNSNLKDLKQKESELKTQIDKLESSLVIDSKGSTLILITDTNSKCLNDMVGLLDSNNLKGVIAIDDDYSPLDYIDGYLNKEDINNLINKGYEVVLTIDSNSDIKQIYDKYSYYYDIKGFYFVDVELTKTQLEDIKQLDDVCVITYNNKIDDQDIVCFISVGSYSTISKSTFETSLKDSSTVAYRIGYGATIDKYNQSNCESMLDNMISAQNNNQTKICNISEAIDRYGQLQDLKNSEDYIEKLNSLSELNQELEKIQNQIYMKQ